MAQARATTTDTVSREVPWQAAVAPAYVGASDMAGAPDAPDAVRDLEEDRDIQKVWLNALLQQKSQGARTIACIAQARSTIRDLRHAITELSSGDEQLVKYTAAIATKQLKIAKAATVILETKQK